jgi:hypothetical protein
VPGDGFKRIDEGQAILYIIGYVDYIDAFDRHWRGGYPRVYDPVRNGTDNNLTFVPAAGYNYDRARKPGEGRDWGTR